jgi:multicomponent Na+:H+ antiporter subunit D
VGHGLVKAALFLAAGILLNRFASVDENYLHGKGRRFPGLAALFFVGGLALSGLPPFATCLGKSLIEEAGDRAGYAWLAWVLLVASVLTGGAVLRAGGQIFLGIGAPQNPGAGTPTTEVKATNEDYDRPPWVMFMPVAVLLALALVVGLWPGLEDRTREAAARLEDRPAYAAAVFGEVDASLRVETEKEGSRLSGLVYGVSAAAGAILLAALALLRRRLPAGLCAIADRVGGPVFTGLRALHSGNVADYVTWVVVGVAVVGCLFTVLFQY